MRSGRLTVGRPSHAASSGEATCSRVNPVGLVGAPSPSSRFSRLAFFGRAAGASPLAAGRRFGFGFGAAASASPSPSSSSRSGAAGTRSQVEHGLSALCSTLIYLLC